MNQKYWPLGKYIKRCKEKNTNLIAIKQFGLNSDEGLIELSKSKREKNKSSFWILRTGRMAVNLFTFASTKELALGEYCFNELGVISNTYTVFEITNPALKGQYLALILKSQKTKNKLLHYACHGNIMSLPWEDFCSLQIRVPSTERQEDLIKNYQSCEKLIKLKREINNLLEEWMICLYHLTFDKLTQNYLEDKQLKDIFLIRGGQPPQEKILNFL